MKQKAPDATPAAATDWTPKPCPICGKLAVIEMRPFCSKRCADVDLHRWLGGTYAIPVVEGNRDEESDDSEES